MSESVQRSSFSVPRSELPMPETPGLIEKFYQFGSFRFSIFGSIKRQFDIEEHVPRKSMGE